MKFVLFSLFILLQLVIIPKPASASQLDEMLRARVEYSFVAPLLVGNEQIHCQKTLARFYEGRLYEPAWASEHQVTAFLQELAQADKEGLQPTDYHLQEIKALLPQKNSSPHIQVDLDLLLTDAFLLYSTHLLTGKVNPQTLDAEWYVSPAEGNPLATLQQALLTRNLREVFKSIKPKHPTYLSLKKGLVHYKALQAAGGWEAIPEGPSLKPGMDDVRVPLLRKRLQASKDLAANDSLVGNQYDAALETAVMRFQQRHGLQADGVLGNKTRLAMNVPVEKRIAQIQVNLERWRWLAQSFGNYYVLVNIADYSLVVMKNGEVTRTHKVIAGKQARKTPVLSSKLTYLVLNPTWTVPPTILAQDVLPAARKGLPILKTKNLTIYDSQGKVVDPATVNWNSTAAKGYTYRQPAGPDNALGAVKFMFMNPFNIYLHDTPSRNLFDETERALSSGCIRVQYPLELAAYLLQNEQKYSLEQVKKIVAGKQTTTIALPEQPMVHILYWTSWTTEDGKVQFRPDVYDRDDALLNALQEKAPLS